MESEDSPFCNCLFYSSNALARNLTRMAEEEFSMAGVAPSYAFLLMTVNSEPGLRPSKIGQRMQLSPSTVTRLIEKLEYRGFLERKINGKYTEVYSTALGSGLDIKLQKAWSNLSKRYSDLLGEEATKKLTTEVYKASQTLET